MFKRKKHSHNYAGKRNGQQSHRNQNNRNHPQKHSRPRNGQASHKSKREKRMDLEHYLQIPGLGAEISLERLLNAQHWGKDGREKANIIGLELTINSEVEKIQIPILLNRLVVEYKKKICYSLLGHWEHCWLLRRKPNGNLPIYNATLVFIYTGEKVAEESKMLELYNRLFEQDKIPKFAEIKILEMDSKNHAIMLKVWHNQAYEQAKLEIKRICSQENRNPVIQYGTSFKLPKAS